MPILFRDTSYQPFRLDGVTRIAGQFSERLSSLTMQPPIKRLGLGWLAGVLSNHGCLRSHGAWCTSCMKEMTREGGAYIPLVWMVDAVIACPIHAQRLQEACPHCGERISLRRAWGARCTECPHCCSTLCSETQASQRSGSLATAKASPTEIAKSRLVANFVEATQRLEPDKSPRAPDVQRLIESAIRRGFFDTRAALALEAGISKGTLHLYEHQGGYASLDCLARLAARRRRVAGGLVHAPTLVRGRCRRERR